MSDLSFLQNTGKARKELRFTPDGEIETILSDWVSERIEEAQRILKETGRNSSSTLSNSIQALPFEQSDGSFLVKVIAEDYYDFVNQGVDGLERSFGSPYSFKNLGVGSKMKQAFSEFIRRKGIKGLSWINNEGERIQKILTTAKDYEGASYVLAKATKKRGIKPSHFMDIAFSQEHIDDLSKQLGKKIEQIFQ